jgi:hypothetical protein
MCCYLIQQRIECAILIICFLINRGEKMFFRKADLSAPATGPRNNPEIKENLGCKEAAYQALKYTLNPFAHDEDAIRAETIAVKQCFNQAFRKKK